MFPIYSLKRSNAYSPGIFEVDHSGAVNWLAKGAAGERVIGEGTSIGDKNFTK